MDVIVMYFVDEIERYKIYFGLCNVLNTGM